MRLRIEGRLVPATVRWINPAGGEWGVASNWDVQRLPTGSDDVIIDLAGVTVHVSTGEVNHPNQANTLTSTDALDISGGFLSLSRTSSITNAVSLAGGYVPCREGPVAL
jgi:hypothetical protein